MSFVSLDAEVLPPLSLSLLWSSPSFFCSFFVLPRRGAFHHRANHNTSQGIPHSSWVIVMMRMMTLFGRLWLPFIFLSSNGKIAFGCTDLLVTPGASEDGSAMIAYNADSEILMGLLYHYPSNSPPEGTMRKVYDWDSGRYLGEIPEADELYNVVGNINEHGLCIGESTFGGVSVLSSQEGAKIDYGSLIYITLSRARTAREAIHVMTELMDEYGYASQGESFSIADHSGEVWLMEVIGRGNDYRGKLGAVWVARRIPDGYVTAHANQARITTFPRDDPENCLYADDVVDVAVHYGLYPPDADPLEFSFSDAFCPVDFSAARFSDARVWSLFGRILASDDDRAFEMEYYDYATGKNLTHRMPLWVRPKTKLSLRRVMDAMGNHYEGMALSSGSDVGSGLYGAPYRPRPLVWRVEDYGDGRARYHNERSVATQQTGWNFVAQMRPWMPRELSALAWFAVDDSSTSPRVPVHGCSTRVSKPYGGKGSQDGVVEPLLTFDLDRAFWVQNMVSNLAYSRWNDIYPVVRAKIDAVQDALIEEVRIVEAMALEVYNSNNNGIDDDIIDDDDIDDHNRDGPDRAIEMVTAFDVLTGDVMHKDWFEFYGYLFARFRDFYEVVPNPDNPNCECEALETGLSEEWKERIVSETGDHYRVLHDRLGQPSDETVIRAA